MTQFIARRLLSMVPTLILISIVSFIIIQLPPCDYLTTYAAQLSAMDTPVSRESLSYLRERYGLDRPVYVQYWIWISGFVQGDFGESFEFNRPVSALVWERLGLTLAVALSTMLFTWIIAIPIGIYSAVRQYSLFDYVFTFIGFVGLAVPNFLLALVLLFVSVFVFNIPSVGGLFSPQYLDEPWSLAKFFDLLTRLWLPVVVVGTAGTAGLIRIMRANMLDVLHQPYVQTARSKGVRERVVIYKHATRNAINPLISIMGMQLPGIFSGETITAIVLSLPTLGPLLYRSLLSQDMFLAGTILMFLAIALVIGNLIADVLLAVVDPRIRYG
jgi:peptide/nickel transport system permease protein